MVNCENSIIVCETCEGLSARLKALEQRVYNLEFLKIDVPLRAFIYMLDESVRIEASLIKDLFNIVEDKKENEC